MSQKDFWEVVEDFFGTRVFSVTQADDPTWRIADTSAVGTPTYALVTPSSSGEVALDFDAQVEVQNVNLYQSDVLQYDIDKIREIEFRVKQNQATMDATTILDFGIASARNDDATAIAALAFFSIVGGTDTTAVVLNTDANAAEDNNNIATGQSLANVYKDFKISFALGTSDVRFFIAGQPVATGTTFDMSNYTGSLQLYVQISKTANANTDGVTIDRISINGVR